MKRAPKPKLRDTYDLRMEGMPWYRDLSRDDLYHAVEAAYKARPENDNELLFVIAENASGLFEEQFFCMDYIMWEALCETPGVMTMYLNMFWHREE